MKWKTLLLVTLLGASPGSVWAIDGEFYTYGGFDAVVAGFQRIALIFSDNAYQTLFYSVIVLGIFLGSINLIMRVATGAKASPLGWLVPIFVGVLLYLGMVIPTGTMHVYSDRTNRYMAVPGVPDGVIVVAHVLNSIEKGLIEIIETSTDPKSFIYQAGGTGYMGILSLASSNFTIPDPHLGQNLNEYIDKCVSYEVMEPTSTLTVEELRRGTADFRVSLGKAAHPAIGAVMYSTANPHGTVTTCADAWANYISPQLNNGTTFDAALDETCSEIGFDPSVAASRQQCRTAIQDVLGDLGITMTSTDFVRQAFLARQLHDVFRSGNTTALTNYKFMVNAKGTMVAANEWLPTMKGVLTAIALGLVPILALFLPTPLLGKSLSFFLGMMIWIVSWGVTDALLHSFAVDFAGKALLDIRNLATITGAMGMDAFYFTPPETAKVLGMFGMIRMSGLMLATVLTGVLVKFGGHALASMAGNLTGQVQGAGLQAARLTEDPSGRAAAIQANSAAMPTQTIANAPRYGYSEMTHGSMVSKMSQVEAASAHELKMAHQQSLGNVPGGSAYGAAGGELLNRSMRSGQIANNDGVVSNYSAGATAGTGLSGSQATQADGWTQKTNERVEGGAVVGSTNTFVGASGTITETAGADGQSTVQIQATGLTNSFARDYRETGIEEGAHTLSSGENWNQMMQEVDSDSKSSSEARAFKEGLTERVSDSVQNKVEEGSAFRQVKDETKRSMLEAGATMGLSGGGLLAALSLGSVKIGASTSGKYSLVGQDGKSASFSASESEMKSLTQEVGQIREEAITQTMKTDVGQKYAASSSSQDNASEGFSYLRRASIQDTTSASQNMDLMTAYVDDRAAGKFDIAPGDVTNGMRKSVLDDMNQQRIGSGADQESLNNDMRAWSTRRYDDYLDTPKTGNHVMRDVAGYRNRAGAGVESHRAVGEDVSGRVRGAVADNSFEDPRPGTIKGPNVEAGVNHQQTRRGVVNEIYEDNGAFDFGGNAIKQAGRDAASPFVPQPEEPDARNLPGMNPSGETGPQTTDSLQEKRGNSAIDGRPVHPTEFHIPEESLQRMDEMLKELGGK
jgi:conjugal transfer mating pair stabilization protein TraG